MRHRHQWFIQLAAHEREFITQPTLLMGYVYGTLYLPPSVCGFVLTVQEPVSDFLFPDPV